MKKVRFVGLNRDVWLPDDIEVIIDIVPSWRTNIRSRQIFTGQNKTTWHDTGNPNSNALGERNYLHSGAGGRTVGYNFAFDADRIIQLTPLNEVTWAAGTASGNKYSWHAEQCLNTDWDGALRVGAALHGGLCAAMGWNVDDALVQHFVWYGKDCPRQIRRRGLWSTVISMTKTAAQRALAAANGGTAPEAPSDTTYVQPRPIMINDQPWDGEEDAVINDITYYADKRVVEVAVDALNCRLWADSSSDLVRSPLKKGDAFDVLGWVEGEDISGENRWWVTPYGTRVWTGGTVETPQRTPDEDGKPDTDGLATIIDGRVYYPVGVAGEGRDVTAIEDAPLHRWANFNSEEVGHIKQGDVVTALYWCKGDALNDEYVWWILEPSVVDEVTNAIQHVLGNTDEVLDIIDNGPRLHVVFTDARPS